MKILTKRASTNKCFAGETKLALACEIPPVLPKLCEQVTRVGITDTKT